MAEEIVLVHNWLTHLDIRQQVLIAEVREEVKEHPNLYSGSDSVYRLAAKLADMLDYIEDRLVDPEIPEEDIAGEIRDWIMEGNVR